MWRIGSKARYKSGQWIAGLIDKSGRLRADTGGMFMRQPPDWPDCGRAGRAAGHFHGKKLMAKHYSAAAGARLCFICVAEVGGDKKNI